MKFDLDQIRSLGQLLRDLDLESIELGKGKDHLRLVRARAGGPASRPVVEERSKVTPPPNEEASVANPANHPGTIKAPLVGMVYLSPEPGAAPFATPGERVTKGQTLFIIEAMKVMNPILSPWAGELARIMVENGEGVEYGQPIAIIEPAPDTVAKA